MALKVSGKTALVTGGGSGIGLEFTKLLLANGCNVLVADLGLRPEADEAFRPYQSVPGEPKAEPGLLFHNCDVTNWKQLRSAFNMAVSAFGQLDIVCPNAGVFEPVS
jgi:3-hydroxybutyrate dehydrogenase